MYNIYFSKWLISKSPFKYCSYLRKVCVYFSVFGAIWEYFHRKNRWLYGVIILIISQNNNIISAFLVQYYYQLSLKSVKVTNFADYVWNHQTKIFFKTERSMVHSSDIWYFIQYFENTDARTCIPVLFGTTQN